jgi:cytochrome c oxidase subunit 1
MNSTVHNTAWIMGHFHVTLGTTVALTFMGATYWLMPRISGRELRFRPLAQAQPYLWFAGMMLFSTSYHIAGLRGLPRRVYSASLSGTVPTPWHTLTQIAALGAVCLFISAWSYVIVVAATWLSGKKIPAPSFEFASSLRPPVASIWDRYGLWTAVAVLIVLAGYGYPIIHLLMQHRYGSPPYQPF